MDYFQSSAGMWTFLGAASGILALLVTVVPMIFRFFRPRAPAPMDGNFQVLSEILAEQRCLNTIVSAMVDGVLLNADLNLEVVCRLGGRSQQVSLAERQAVKSEHTPPKILAILM